MKPQPHQPGANPLPVIRQPRLLLAVMISVAFIRGAERHLNGDEKAAMAPTLVLVDGSTVSASSLTIANGRVRGTGIPRDLTLDDLQQIRLPDVDDFPQTNASAIVSIRGGSRLWAMTITIADEKARIEWSAGEPLVVPVDLLNAIRADVGNDRPEFEKSLAAPPAEQDRLLIKGDDDQINAVSGLVDSLDADQWKFTIAGKTRSMPRSRIYGVVFAQPAVATKQSSCAVAFRDGSRLSGENLLLSNDKGTLSLGPGANVQFDWSAVRDVAIRSSRVAYLSDVMPIKEEQTPIVTSAFPAQRDKSAAGARLQIGSQFFDKGLGVHSRSAVTFATAGKWDLFAAKIGLDAAANGKGDCVFQVLADGKSIFEKRVKGDDLVAEDIRLPITACQELTLLVEPGEGLDMSDHADWCDARLIRNKK
jgi:hypothetical protein